jgi:peroxiredoxin
MAKTPSTMLELTTSAPDFTLADASGQNFVLADQLIDKGLLVIFMCNHCPFVIHIREQLVENIRRYQEQGLTVVAINSNDYRVHQDDNPAKMAADTNQFDYSFPYLVDEDQSVAKAYRAACTPDLYLFDSDKKLVYRGQFDDSRPGNNVPVTGADLSAAVDELVGGKTISVSQQPSLGCNIKWKPGNEPDYFN